MKNYLILSLAAISAFLPIHEAGAQAPDESKLAKARIYLSDQSQETIIALAYKNGLLTYKLTAQDLNRVQIRAPRLESIYFMEPKVFTEAMSLYNGRKYAEAKEKFAECEKLFKPLDTAPNNYAKLAGFYKMECSRRMFDLDALSEEMEKFLKTGLTRETQLQQLEVNTFWEAVRLKDWDRLDRLAQAWRKRKVTGDQRAQISYCHGLALENLSGKDPNMLPKALNAYNMTLSADFTSSIELVVAAAGNALGLYNKDPEVQQAIRFWKTEEENPNSTGYLRLMEANALVSLYKQAGFDQVKPLDESQTKFLKYAPSDDDTAPTPPKPEVKKEDKKKPAKKEPEAKKSNEDKKKDK
ncbi:MAG: hypothetical protein AB8F34_15755 [Akkermansiaceae bacterium]